MKTWFITGISRGFGLALAQAAVARGDTVVGTVRSGRPDIAPGPGALHVLTLEMGDAEAIKGAVNEALRLTGGRLDVVVNNAGYGLLGAMEDASEDEIARLFAVDVFGPARLVRAVLPTLRAQGAGHIVNITSIAGRAPGAGSAYYAAAKHAMEGLSAALAAELPAGIKVTAVAPGAFRTDFLSDHSLSKSAEGAEGYAETVGKATAAFDAMAGKQAGDPARAAQALLQLVDSPNPPLQLLLGSDALKRMEGKLDRVAREMEDWRPVTQGTDFPQGS
jgi:NAD(P)-dependent dehydrogenase (short-subunit alcohol dehydrogenase family)